MNGNGYIKRSRSGAAESKTAADVEFKATSNSTPSVAINGGHHKAEEKKKRSSTGEKIKKRLSLRPRTSLLHRSKGSKDDPARDASVSASSSRSAVRPSSTQDVVTPARSVSSGLLSEDSPMGRDSIRSDQRQSLQHTPDPSQPSSSTTHVNLEPVVQSSPGPELDPARLVQMALSLSENRRRHSSLPAQLAAPAESPGSRQSNAALHRSLQSSPMARNPHVDAALAVHSSPRTSSQYVHHSGASPNGLLSVPEDTQDNYTPATLVRAERARRHFELAGQHRRLLQILEDNSKSQSQGTSTTHSYNPLRALRERRLRDPDSPSQSSDAGAFQNVADVEAWVNQVNAATKGGSLEPTAIPTIKGDGSALSAGISGHKRGGTADTIIHRPVNAWTITPAELLLETYHKLKGDIQADDEVVDSQAVNGSTVKPLPQNIFHRHHNSKGSDDEPDNVRRRFLPLKAADKLRAGRLNRLTRSDSASSASSVEAAYTALFDPNMDNVNTAPLRRHMAQLMEAAEHEPEVQKSPQTPDHWGLAQAHQYAARQRAASRANAMPKDIAATTAERQTRNSLALQEQRSKGTSSGDASRQSSPLILPQFAHESSSSKQTNDMHHHKSKLGTVRRITQLSKPSTRSSDDRTTLSDLESTTTAVPSREDDPPIDPTRLSVESARPPFFRRHKTTDSTSSMFSATRTDTKSSVPEPASAVSRHKFGGRIADIVRSESSKFGDKVRSRDKKGRKNLSDVSANASDISDVEGFPDSAKSSKQDPEGRGRASLERTTSRNRFHMPTLPSFKAITPREPQLLTPIMSNENDDHISRQQAAQRLRGKSPRFQKLAPPPIDSSSSYHRAATDTQGRISSLDHDDDPADDLISSGGVQGVPMTESGRAGSDVEQRQASDRVQSTTQAESGPLRMRDIARVRTILLAAGIKAETLAEKLNTPSPANNVLPKAVVQACTLDSSSLIGKPRIEQTPIAVRMLCAYLDESTRGTHEAAQNFQAKRLQTLIAKHEILKSRVTEDLADLVHGGSDAADAFNVDLSTQATMRIKQVNDAVDDVLRLRRRQFRLVRLALFKLLEWFVLAMLWFLWFVVVCFQTVKKTIVFFFRFLHWLFTF